MKKILFLNLILFLNVFTAGADTKSLSDYEVNQAIEQTLHDIQSGLKNIKQEFPQLANIDYAATITRNPSGKEGTIRFNYTKGFVQENSVPKDGASILVEIKYPAAIEDVSADPLEGKLFSLGNGNICVYRYLVRADESEEGKNFKSKADQIILMQLISLQKRLR